MYIFVVSTPCLLESSLTSSLTSSTPSIPSQWRASNGSDKWDDIAMLVFRQWLRVPEQWSVEQWSPGHWSQPVSQHQCWAVSAPLSAGHITPHHHTGESCCIHTDPSHAIIIFWEDIHSHNTDTAITQLMIYHWSSWAQTMDNCGHSADTHSPLSPLSSQTTLETGHWICWYLALTVFMSIEQNFKIYLLKRFFFQAYFEGKWLWWKHCLQRRQIICS